MLNSRLFYYFVVVASTFNGAELTSSTSATEKFTISTTSNLPSSTITKLPTSATSNLLTSTTSNLPTSTTTNLPTSTTSTVTTFSSSESTSTSLETTTRSSIHTLTSIMTDTSLPSAAPPTTSTTSTSLGSDTSTNVTPASQTSTTNLYSSDLSTSHTVTTILSTTNVSVLSEGTSSTSPITGGADLSVILPAVIVPIIIIIILISLFILFLYFKRKGRETPGFKSVTSKPIDIMEFESKLKDMNANSQLKYSEEFSSLAAVGSEYSKDTAGLEGNREKNRYTDIKPYDISRVKLSINPEDESDYINASWIPGYFSRRQYIAAQGPMQSTQDDFWRMIWEYNSKIIVMLTKTFENNRIKCCQYWPSGREVVMYGDIAVHVINEIEADNWVIREMDVSMGQQKRSVRQCYFSKWPDMKTPEESSSIIEFIKMIRSYCPMRGSSPIVVHCSAGVGRTGAYVAIDTAMYQIEEEEKVDIFGIVYKMRLNRVSMVQNERQYIFIYDTVGEMIRNYLEEKGNRKHVSGQAINFFGNLPKNDSIPDTLTFQNYETSNGALISHDDDKSLL